MVAYLSLIAFYNKAAVLSSFLIQGAGGGRYRRFVFSGIQFSRFSIQDNRHEKRCRNHAEPPHLPPF